MAGYNECKMSNNAVLAYEDGEMPLSKWWKSDIIESINDMIDNNELRINFDLDILKKIRAADLKDLLLIKTSWHHTSSSYNKTDFYSLNSDKLERLVNSDLEKFVNNKKSVKEKSKKEEPKIEKFKCKFLEWSGTKKHLKATEVVEIGEIRGNWFFRKDGSKKSTKANGFRVISKVD